jgi:hypothetical protein
MRHEQPERPANQDAELEQKIRKERKFSLAKAIGRLAGPGMIKRVSPVTRQEQAGLEIEEFLARLLTDVTGALQLALLGGVQACDLLLTNYEPPHLVLAGYLGAFCIQATF